MNDHSHSEVCSEQVEQRGAYKVGTYFLTTRNIRNLYSAIACANSGGAVLDTLITIKWPLVCPGGQSHHLKIFHSWKKNLGQWIKDKRCNYIIYYYVHENPGGEAFHTHMAAYIEPHLRGDFVDWANKSLRSLSLEKELHKDALEIDRGRDRPSVRGQWNWFNYVCKGLDPKAFIDLKKGYRYEAKNLIFGHLEPQGFVMGERRCGVSEAISAKSRNTFYGTEDASIREPFISELDRQIERRCLNPAALYTDDEYRTYLEDKSRSDW